MTLSLYIARRFLWTVAKVFLAFFAGPERQTPGHAAHAPAAAGHG